MRTLPTITPLLLLAVAACSQAANDQAADAAMETSEEATATIAAGKAGADAPPRIGANVAPGVAFNYLYNFGLPAANIARVQEDHAALCERMGIVHCRVTGMHYVKEGDGSIVANMAFKLDPAMAHSFGRDATDMVEKADGSLTDSRIDGSDAGSDIVANDKAGAQINAELAKIEAQLKIPNLSREVRSRLVEQQVELRERLRGLASDRDAKVESLATTPVMFDYTANEAILGFDNRSPVQKAFKASGQSFTAMVSFVILAIGMLAPWVALGGAIFWLFRRFRPKKTDSAN